MKRLSSLALCFTFVAASYASAVPLDEKPKLNVWRADRHNQSGGYADNGADGVAYRVSWNGGGRSLMEVMLPDRPPLDAWQPGMEVTLWVRDEPAGAVKAVALRIVDESGEVYQFGRRLSADADGWQKLTWTLDPAQAETTYGGDKNKAFDGAPKWFGLVMVTRQKPEEPVSLWISETEGGAVDAMAAVSGETGGAAPATRQAHAAANVDAAALEAPPAEGGLPVVLARVDQSRAISQHAAKKKKHSMSDASEGQPWRELRWANGAKRLMEVPIGGRPDLLAFDKGVTLSIPIDPTGYEGFSKMAVRAMDANGEIFQWPIRLAPGPAGWRDVRVELDPNAFETSYGGDAKHRGKIDLPMRFQSLLLLAPNDQGGSVKLGHISRNPFDPNDISANARLARVSVDLKRTANIPLFRADRDEPVVVQVRNAGSADASFDLELAFEHFDGTVAQWSKPGLTVPAQQTQEIVVEDALDKTGWYEMRVTLGAEDGKVEKGAQTLLHLEPAGRRAHPPAEGFWLGIDARIGSPKQGGWQAELASLIGADYLRVGHTWPKIQRNSGDSFAWAQLDAELALLEEHGLKGVYGLTFTPKWAVADGAMDDLQARIKRQGLNLKPSGPPSRMAPDPDAWRAFVREMAKYGSGKNIIAYELWNEPDLSGFYRGTTDQFIELMRIAHEEVKPHHPDAVLLGAGIATMLGHGGHNLNPDLIERSIVEGQDYYDSVCLHQHGHFRGFRQAVDGPMAEYRARLREDKPIFFTETGVATGHDISRKRQAHELVKKIAFARARGAQGFTWFVMRMRHENHYAMVSGGRTASPFPQVAAFNELAKMMRGRTFEKEHDCGPGAWVLEFAGENDRLAVAWAEQTQAVGQLVVFALPAGATAQVVDIMGNASALPVRDGLAVLELSEDVRYVLITGGAGRVAGTLASLPATPAGVPGQRVEAGAFLSNPTENDLTYTVAWSAPGNAPATRTVTVPAGTERQRITYALTMPPAAPAGGAEPQLSLTYDVNNGAMAGSLSTPLRVAQLIPAGSVGQRPPDFVLNELNATVINVNQADPNRAKYVWSGAEDLGVSVWLGLEGDALVMQADVSDDVHLQPNPSGTMWKADGLQFAFQFPGQSRHWEFGAGLRESGPAAVTYLSAGVGDPDPSEAFDLTIDRIDGGLRYRLSMPCKSMGTDAARLRNEGMRFNLIVNDDDGGGREGWAQVADGIARSKEPSLFPLVIFE